MPINRAPTAKSLNALPRKRIGCCAAFLGAMAFAQITVSCAAESSTRAIAEQRLADQNGSFEIYRKLTGRLDGKHYFVSSEGNIYGFKPGEPAVPIMSIMGLWTYQQDELPDSDGYLEKRVFCGVFLPFGSTEPAPTIVNPLNGKTVELPKRLLKSPWLYQTMLPHGIYGVGDWSDVRLFPKEEKQTPIHQSRVFGDHIHMTEQIYNQDFIDLVTKYEEITWTGDLNALMDETIPFVPSTRIFTAVADAHDREWLEMGDEQAYIIFHVSGRKVEKAEDLPSALLNYVQENCPGNLNADVFPEPLP